MRMFKQIKSCVGSKIRVFQYEDLQTNRWRLLAGFAAFASVFPVGGAFSQSEGSLQGTWSMVGTECLQEFDFSNGQPEFRDRGSSLNTGVIIRGKTMIGPMSTCGIGRITENRGLSPVNIKNARLSLGPARLDRNGIRQLPDPLYRLGCLCGAGLQKIVPWVCSLFSSHPVSNLGETRVEGNCRDDAGVATIRESAASHAFVIREIRAPVAQIQSDGLPVVR